jgi:hypothetical protein
MTKLHSVDTQTIKKSITNKTELEHAGMGAAYSVAYMMDHYYLVLIAATYLTLFIVGLRTELHNARSTD